MTVRCTLHQNNNSTLKSDKPLPLVPRWKMKLTQVTQCTSVMTKTWQNYTTRLYTVKVKTNKLLKCISPLKWYSIIRRVELKGIQLFLSSAIRRLNH